MADCCHAQSHVGLWAVTSISPEAIIAQMIAGDWCSGWLWAAPTQRAILDKSCNDLMVTGRVHRRTGTHVDTFFISQCCSVYDLLAYLHPTADWYRSAALMPQPISPALQPPASRSTARSARRPRSPPGWCCKSLHRRVRPDLSSGRSHSPGNRRLQDRAYTRRPL